MPVGAGPPRLLHDPLDAAPAEAVDSASEPDYNKEGNTNESSYGLFHQRSLRSPLFDSLRQEDHEVHAFEVYRFCRWRDRLSKAGWRLAERVETDDGAGGAACHLLAEDDS